jgi:hypothetical protein
VSGTWVIFIGPALAVIFLLLVIAFKDHGNHGDKDK